MISPLLVDIGIVFVVATVFAYIASALRQPLIPAYVLAGVLIGPLGLGLITSYESIFTLSELGIAFLLFITGMEIEPRKLRNVGVFTFVAGTAQIVLTFFLGMFAAAYFGFGNVEALYVGLILAFSSTMVVIKLLSDKNELNTLHGRIMIGLLLIEDVVAVVAMSLLANLGNFNAYTGSLALVKGLGLFSIAIVGAKFILPVVFRYVAKSQELLFITAVSMCFLFSGAAYVLGFSIAIGGFIAGIAMATFPYNLEIIGRVRSLRDFFAIMFFVALGMQLMWTGLGAYLYPILAFLAIVLLFRPITRVLFCTLHGYEIRTAFLTGMSTAQISEFGLILALMGLTAGHISATLFSIVAIIALVTITLTSYFIEYDQKIYGRMAGMLSRLHRILPKARKQILEHPPDKQKDHVVLFGGGRMGRKIIELLGKKDMLVVDYDPEIVKELIAEKVPCTYGDMGNVDILQKLNMKDAKLVISTVPSEEDNMLLLEIEKNVPIIVRTHNIEEAIRLYDAGASYVIMPTYLGGEILGHYVLNYFHKKASLAELRKKHVHELRKMREQEILEKYGEKSKRSTPPKHG